MKKSIFAILLCLTASAQVSRNTVLFLPTSPSGACFPSYIVSNTVTGALSACANGTWVSVGGGGGTGTVTTTGTMTSTGITTSAGTTVIQTPCATCTLSSAGAMAVTSVATGSTPPTNTPGTGGTFVFGEGTAVVAAAGTDACYADSTAHTLLCSWNNGSFYRLPQVVYSGTITLATTAISSASHNLTTQTATGVVSTDYLIASVNGAIIGVTGYVPSTSGTLSVYCYAGTGNINCDVVNNTSGSITPGAITVNAMVQR